jgi:hypothetical protein
MNDEAAEKSTVFAPLSNFVWDGEEFAIKDFGNVEPASHIAEIIRGPLNVCDAENKQVEEVTHWLSFDQQSADRLVPREKVNIFLLALWIAIPTRTHVRVRFEFQKDCPRPLVTCDHNRFHWTEGHPKDKVESEHLEQASSYIPRIRSTYLVNKRLRNALHLTFAGCISIHWQVAFICFSAAAEAIVAYAKDRIGHRLSMAFACLTQHEKEERDAAYREFLRLYYVRSDIMHGRAAHRSDFSKNRRELAKLTDVLRELWQTVFSSPRTLEALERGDDYRKEFFEDLQEGYDAPGQSTASEAARSSNSGGKIFTGQKADQQ